MTQDEIEVVMAFLSERYPRVYDDALDHLTSYQEFIIKQSRAWKRLKVNNPDLQTPKLFDKDDEEFFEASTRLKRMK